jgi:hypothetical protein
MEVSPAKYKYNSFFQRDYNPNNTKKNYPWTPIHPIYTLGEKEIGSI